MKPDTKTIFEYIRKHNGEDITAISVAEELGFDTRKVNGSFTSFVKKDWGYREEKEIELADGSHQKIKFLRLTELGMTVDPDAPAEKAEE
jgi:hypothetical protein